MSVKKKVRARELSKQDTREALLSAGAQAFSEEGLDTPSLDSICERAGFTRGAFYVHFKDRDDFVSAVMERTFERFLDAIIATGDAALDLQKTIHLFAQAIEAGAFPVSGAVPIHQLLAACSRSAQVRERFVAVLQEAAARVARAATEGQDAGTVRRDVSADHVGRLLLSVALGVQCLLDIKFPLDVSGTTADVAKLVRTQR